MFDPKDIKRTVGLFQIIDQETDEPLDVIIDSDVPAIEYDDEVLDGSDKEENEDSQEI